MTLLGWIGLLLALNQDPEARPLEGERRFASLRQLTTGGTHAEAYWSFDGTKLVYQATREGDRADQIYVLDLATGRSTRITDGRGKAT